MKLLKSLLLLTLVLAAGCGESPLDPPAAGVPSDLDQLEAQARLIGQVPVSPLMIVAEASVVCSAMDAGNNVFRTARADGTQIASWSTSTHLLHWSVECWSGLPSFPGSENWDTCSGATNLFANMDCTMVTHGAWDVIRAVAGMDGFQMLHSDLYRDEDNTGRERQNYRIWFADPDGEVWIWRWEKVPFSGA